MKFLTLITIVLSACDLPTELPEYVTITNVAPGIVLEQYIDVPGRQRIHVLKIRGRDVNLVSNRGGCKTVSRMGTESGAIAGVNWSFAYPWPRQPGDGCTPFALTKVDGEVIDPDHGQHRYQHLLSKTTEMTLGIKGTKYFLYELEEDNDWPAMPTAASGWPTLLPYTSGNWPHAPAFDTKREPRTGAGVKIDGTLMFVVVDGRRPDAAGMSLPEFANLFRNLGAVKAVNADGGGSSTMWVDGDVVNRPSGIFEREVADGFFVY